MYICTCMYIHIHNWSLCQTSLPVNAPVSGVIEAIIVPDGEKVTAGSLLCKIDTEG